jgi:HEAT repeat protein
MRRCLLLIVVLSASLLLPASTVAQTRTYIQMPWRQTGLGSDVWAHSLGAHIKLATDITVLQVVVVDRPKGFVYFKATAALKGKAPRESVRHQFGHRLGEGEREAFLEWARPGNIAICFHEKASSCYVCIGNAWYEVEEEGLVTDSLDSATQVYVGPADRLREHIVAILAGKEVVITATALSHQGPIARDWLRGDKGRVWRLRASAEFTYRDWQVPVDESAEFVGWGGDKADVPRLTAALKDQDALDRCEAAADLGQIGPAARDAVADLRLALKDRDDQVRVRAALALARIDPDDLRAIPALLDALKDRKVAVRRAAVAALADLPPPTSSVMPALLRSLKDDADESVRAGAAFALRQIAPPGRDIGKRQAELIAAFTKAVRDDASEAVRQWCIRALRNFGQDAKEAIPILMFRGKGKGSDRDVALETVTRMGPVAVPALYEALKESQDRLRLEIMACLEEIGPAAQQAVPLLRDSLESDDPRERTAAVAALMRIAWRSEGPRVTEVLRKLIERKIVCGNAALRVEEYLWKLGPDDKIALPAILAWQKHARSREAPFLLTRIRCTTEALAALRAEVDDTNGADPEIAYSLWRLGYKREAVTLLRKRWETGAKIERDERDLFVLADIGPDAVEMVPLLKKALRELPRDGSGRYARVCLALALWRIQKPIEAGGLVADPRQEALSVLLDLLRDNHIEAMEAVGEIGPEARAAIPFLVKATRHKWWDTRSYAARALGRVGIGSKDAIAALQAALKDKNSQVRLEAAIALTHINRRSAPIEVMVDLLERRPELLRQLDETLIDLGGDAKPVVPTLVVLLRHKDFTIHWTAGRVLRQIDPKAADRAGAP